MMLLISVAFVCLWVCAFVCLFVNAITFELFEISSRNLREQGMVRSSDEFENGSIPMLCGTQEVILTSPTFLFP